jgi:hypothetical protein
MKEKIKEIQDYFIAKLLKGEFEVKEIDEWTMHIVIDSEFDFNLWMCNGPESRRLYTSGNCMTLTFTKEQTILLDNVTKPIYSKMVCEQIIAKKTADLERLKREFEN